MEIQVVGPGEKIEGPAIVAACPRDQIRMLIAGHSHLGAIAAASLYDERASRLAAAAGIGVYLYHPPEADYWKSAIDQAEVTIVVLSYMGNQYNGDFLFLEKDFDICYPPHPDSGADLIPLEVVRQHLLAR